MASFSRLVRTIALIALTQTLLTQAAWAQGGGLMSKNLRSSSTLGVGYVLSVPNTYVGFSLLGIAPKILGGLGLYADVKFSHDSPEGGAEFRDDIEVEDSEFTYGDQLFERRSTWLMADLALAYAVSDELALYFGGGYARKKHYCNYFDNSLTRGFEGFYWILDDEDSGDRVNIIGGMLIRAAPHFVVQTGFDGSPRGVSVGVMFTLPL